MFALFTQKVAAEGTHSFDYRLYFIAPEQYDARTLLFSSLHFLNRLSSILSSDRNIRTVDLSITNLEHSSQAEYANFVPMSAPATLGYY